MAEKKSNGIKGGARPGAGRKKGAPNKKTAETQKRVAESGLTPLDFMLQIMRQPDIEPLPPEAESAEIVSHLAKRLQHDELRFEAAKAAAPYVHPKLASVEMNAKVEVRTLAQELAELNAHADASSN
ncbi:MAG TPA: hypothetical protein VF472_21790 [Burkholderiaceae bacterium]